MDGGIPIPGDQTEKAQLNTGKTLNRVLADLYPESFYHPIWQYFSDAYRHPSAVLIHNLIQSAQQLQNSGDIRDACQIMLVCAVLQSRGNNLTDAVNTTQQALDLAHSNNLKQASNWSAWGACALYVNSGDFQTAVSILGWLQNKLRQEDQWILANHLELIKTSLSGQHHTSRYFEMNKYMFSRWGEPEPVNDVNHGVSSANKLIEEQHPFHHSSAAPGWNWLIKALRNFWSRSFSRWFRHLEQPIPEGRQKTAMPPNNALPVKRRTAKMKSNTKKHRQPSMMKLKTMLENTSVSLTVQMLGEFHVALNDKPIESFPYGRARAIFEYLVFHHHQNIPREVLMNIFWPEVDPKSARNSLNVALYSIRKALKSVLDYPIILFNDAAYGLNPEIEVWIDVEEFDRHNKMAHQLESEGEINNAKVQLEIAANLYQGDFIAEDPYKEWTTYPRERLRTEYMDILGRLSRIYYDQDQYTACATLCKLILKYDNCHEEAHCRLMRCYGRQNQYHLAIRQYHICADALKTELGVEPASQTVKLYERARHREHTQPL